MEKGGATHAMHSPRDSEHLERFQHDVFVHPWQGIVSGCEAELLDGYVDRTGLRLLNHLSEELLKSGGKHASMDSVG